ncbi:MAG: hypothetical protein G3M78_10170 [Candidatus Nitrohelix vancouverensis]|uniref:DUF4148 domain-containing protein n=1 Tax=Candidatus Nitrohelix vancouverensis TaxID=2705534 RepID=A0A7T0C382_9BACT|nr:MAG: hypothetical protein G3M78_10170 [Candidatus Nitrohelix vancouverensis]
MKKALSILAATALTVVFAGSASADTVLPGSYVQTDSSVMSVGQTIMQMGAQQRTLTDAVNRASRADMARNDTTGSINIDYQFGASQSDQSWKSATLNRSTEEARTVGLIPGDCRGDNSDDAYRKQMNQSRDGFMEEPLVSDAQCEDNHATIK